MDAYPPNPFPQINTLNAVIAADGTIIHIGFADYTNILAAGQTQVSLNTVTIPDPQNVLLTYMVQNGQLVQRTTPLTQPQWTLKAVSDPVQQAQAQANAALAAGVQIQSTSTPSLNGTYACSGDLYDDMVQEVAAIGAGLGLVGGGTTMPWIDQTGVQHTMTQAQFLAIATAVRNYAAACKQVIAGVSEATLPTQPVNIDSVQKKKVKSWARFLPTR